jgi:hypothetical protein
MYILDGLNIVQITIYIHVVIFSSNKILYGVVVVVLDGI